MEINRLPVAMYTRPLLIVLIFLYLPAFSSHLSAGTVEDIRAKTGWVPAVHSQRGSAYCPLITPAELIAYRDKYHRNIIKMQVAFSRITTQGLDVWLGPRRNRHRWTGTKFIAFRIKDPKGQVRSSSIYLFLNRNNPDKEVLLGLAPGEKITITGFVRNIAGNKPWIKVTKIDSGWDR